MKLNEFDYYLPPELIAQDPLLKREDSRLLVFLEDKILHRTFNECIEYINKGDILVINDTRVLPARLYGRKMPSGGKIELLLVEELGERTWKCLAKPSRRIKPGSQLEFAKGLLAEISGKKSDETRIITFTDTNYREKLLNIGEIPLPPYIKKPLLDKERYQTVYSIKSGSIAAPTAGLHFTQKLLEKFADKGVLIANLTLHVGLGTFRPVKTDEIEKHRMEEETVQMNQEEIEKINNARSRGGKVIAVGTTTVRALETSANEEGKLKSLNQKTNKFIYPGYKFKIVDALITNFHLPKSTLFMLVCAFIGTEKTHRLYREAIDRSYRFYSFGDACFLLK